MGKDEFKETYPKYAQIVLGTEIAQQDFEDFLRVLALRHQ